jgi:hypothetical protein
MSHLTLTQALCQAEAQARSTLPVELHERLSAAVALVKDGRVFQDSAGDWQVDSSSEAGLTYTVNGSCNCSDHHFNKPRWCKHQLAMFLSQRVLSLMAQPAAPVVPEMVEPWPDNDPEPAPTPPAVPLPEAPPSLPEATFALTLKGTLGGQDAMLTVRGMTASEFQANLAAVRGLLDPPQAPRAPAPEKKSGAAQSPGEGWCAVHQVAMKLNHGKDGRTWLSHKTPEGWCKGH